MSAQIGSSLETFGQSGSYRIALGSGTMAAGLAAGAVVYSFRWGSSTLLAKVRRVRIGAGGITAFAAGFTAFVMVAGRTFTASHTGGNAATLTTNNGKKRTAYATTALTDARISSTAALGGGTVTLDAQGLSVAVGSTGVTAGTVLLPVTDLWTPQDYPLILAQNEGFVIQATVPATGTWTFGVCVDFDEALAA